MSVPPIATEESYPFATSQIATETQFYRFSRVWAGDGIDEEVHGAGSGALSVDSASRQVTVAPYYAHVGGATANQSIAVVVDIPAASASQRLDRIVTRREPGADRCVIDVVQGTPGSGVPPALTRDLAGIWEYTHGYVVVNADGSLGAATNERILLGRDGRYGTSTFRPPDPKPGEFFFQTDTGDTVQWDGAAWVEVGGGGQAPTTQVFTTSGTWNKPDGASAVWVRVVGGGGSGGGAQATQVDESSEGGGGGGGGYVEKLIPAVALGASETVTIGAGGAGSAAGGAGNSGGSSSFGAHCSATGGSGGNLGDATSGPASSGLGGEGGSGSDGDLNADGGPGLTGLSMGAEAADNANGGGTVFSGGSRRLPTGDSSIPLYGAGSAGGANNGGQTAEASIAGADGVVIVTTYF